jgi:hypothetical protein
MLRPRKLTRNTVDFESSEVCDLYIQLLVLSDHRYLLF